MSKVELLRESTIDTNLAIQPLYENEFNLAGKKVKRLKIAGVAIECDVPGINGRSYPKSILEPEVKRFNEKYIKKGRSASELNHPRLDKEGEGKDYSVFEINIGKICAIIEELYFEGNNLMCKMRVTGKNTAGEGLRTLIEEDGYIPGFSLRGAGSVIDTGKGYMEIADDYRLITIDVVGNPSFDEKALITPVYEAVKGKKVQLLTESVDVARKEMLLNTTINNKIRLGSKKFDRGGVVKLMESMTF